MSSKQKDSLRGRVIKNEASQKRPHALKRRPKPPLQIFEDVASSMTKTQEAIRESQPQKLGTHATRRRANDIANVAANPRSKRLKSPARVPNLPFPNEFPFSDFLESPPPSPVRNDIFSTGSLPLAFEKAMMICSNENHTAQSTNSSEGYAGSSSMISDTPACPSSTRQQHTTLLCHESLFGNAADSSEADEDEKGQSSHATITRQASLFGNAADSSEPEEAEKRQSSACDTLPRHQNGQQKTLTRQKSMFDGGFSSDDLPG
ncbi:hypothetical protein B0H67DRAFT_325939 [Lasiosphaeris hirsuta]|uniref:Uncharacterized protein n=1 Tax=Lasiosphaeris hirsuta TaxID=260670 RepID=A0AA40DQ65_9PEZI|nr:hypothetical protein B0H67DRAFT_325939 [Lasiosphaeris hirsuta]